MDNTRVLEIPGARGKVEVDGVLGLLYKVRIDGTVVKRSRGAWQIPMRNGSVSKLSANGVIPGFQTLYLDGKPILKMGAHVPSRAKVTMFSPVLLLLWPLIGRVPVTVLTVTTILAFFLFLMNVVFVKNPTIPTGLRVAIPATNTLFILVAMLILFGTRW